jgi:hypothetical protein
MDAPAVGAERGVALRSVESPARARDGEDILHYSMSIIVSGSRSIEWAAVQSLYFRRVTGDAFPVDLAVDQAMHSEYVQIDRSTDGWMRLLIRCFGLCVRLAFAMFHISVIGLQFSHLLA